VGRDRKALSSFFLSFGMDSFRFWVFAPCATRSGAQEANALPSRPRRSAVRAVKAALLAFIGAKRRALTEKAGGGAQPFGGKGS
ncbi:MAG: hypothetical protein ACREDR_39775, partial [Blastocatellia bacterium]